MKLNRFPHSSVYILCWIHVTERYQYQLFERSWFVMTIKSRSHNEVTTTLKSSSHCCWDVIGNLHKYLIKCSTASVMIVLISVMHIVLLCSVSLPFFDYECMHWWNCVRGQNTKKQFGWYVFFPQIVDMLTCAWKRCSSIASVEFMRTECYREKEWTRNQIQIQASYTQIKWYEYTICCLFYFLHFMTWISVSSFSINWFLIAFMIFRCRATDRYLRFIDRHTEIHSWCVHTVNLLKSSSCFVLHHLKCIWVACAKS